MAAFSMAAKDSTAHEFDWISTLTTACLAIFGLSYISSQPTTITNTSRHWQAASGPWSKCLESQSLVSRMKSGFSDWTMWIGTAWIVSRQENRARELIKEGKRPDGNYWQFLSDFCFVGLLFHLCTKSNGGNQRPSQGQGHGGANEVDNQERKPIETIAATASSTERFFQQIEANLGLTPLTHNRTNQPKPHFPMVSKSNIDGSANFSISHEVPTHKPQPVVQTQAVSQQQRYLEILVHNVSHTDLVLSLEPHHGLGDSVSTQGSYKQSVSGDHPNFCLCRPRFSAFAAYSSRLLENLTSDGQALASRLIYFPRYKRSETDNREIQLPNTLDATSTANNTLPIGFNLHSSGTNSDPLLSISPHERSDLRVRGRDAIRLGGGDARTRMNAVFFPLLGMLLPEWQAKLEEKYGAARVTPKSVTSTGSPTKCKKVVILVSGVGSPRNWTHCMDGNSTEDCAKLMKLLIQTLYPDWVVVQVHSTTNLFRYDENISFVQNELLPCIQSYRDAHATGLAYPDEVAESELHEISKKVEHLAFDPDWRKSMSVTLSFADGSPARNYAIQAALRPYKPTYFHCWQLKTFWHELKLVDSDIEVHTFEEMETLPPIDLTTSLSTHQFQQQQPMALQVVEEMKIFKAEMEAILKDTSEDAHDIRNFWLRKTRKPVLAVLAVQLVKDGPVKLYRGTNMEVSMPTGSLCAERNVIGTALADNPMLKRHHLKIIAVLSVPVTFSSLSQNASHGMPRNSSSTSLGSISRGMASRNNSVDTADPQFVAWNGQRPPRPTSRTNSGEWHLDDNALPAGMVNTALHETTVGSTHNMTPPLLPDSNPPNDRHGDLPVIQLGEESPSVINDGSASASPNATPVRRISLYQHHTRYHSKGGGDVNPTIGPSRGQPSKRRTFVVVQSPEDLNPLRPCGACNEWLKKIAETNPYFQILTFTDKDCNGVYCTSCAE